VTPAEQLGKVSSRRSPRRKLFDEAWRPVIDQALYDA
jgi:hypothetical protein